MLFEVGTFVPKHVGDTYLMSVLFAYWFIHHTSYAMNAIAQAVSGFHHRDLCSSVVDKMAKGQVVL